MRVCQSSSGFVIPFPAVEMSRKETRPEGNGLVGRIGRFAQCRVVWEFELERENVTNQVAAKAPVLSTSFVKCPVASR